MRTLLTTLTLIAALLFLTPTADAQFGGGGCGHHSFQGHYGSHDSHSPCGSPAGYYGFHTTQGGYGTHGGHGGCSTGNYKIKIKNRGSHSYPQPMHYGYGTVHAMPIMHAAPYATHSPHHVGDCSSGSCSPHYGHHAVTHLPYCTSCNHTGDPNDPNYRQVCGDNCTCPCHPIPTPVTLPVEPQQAPLSLPSPSTSSTTKTSMILPITSQVSNTIYAMLR